MKNKLKKYTENSSKKNTVILGNGKDLHVYTPANNRKGRKQILIAYLLFIVYENAYDILNWDIVFPIPEHYFI